MTRIVTQIDAAEVTVSICSGFPSLGEENSSKEVVNDEGKTKFPPTQVSKTIIFIMTFFIFITVMLSRYCAN